MATASSAGGSLPQVATDLAVSEHCELLFMPVSLRAAPKRQTAALRILTLHYVLSMLTARQLFLRLPHSFQVKSHMTYPTSSIGQRRSLKEVNR